MVSLEETKLKKCQWKNLGLKKMSVEKIRVIKECQRKNLRLK